MHGNGIVVALGHDDSAQDHHDTAEGSQAVCVCVCVCVSVVSVLRVSAIFTAPDILGRKGY